MIENLTVEATNKTPSVEFGTTGTLELAGKSIPENSFGFYQPLLAWIDSYSEQPAQHTEIKIKFEYFNTSSSKCLLDIFRKLEALKKSGKSEVKVLWYYEAEDEDMMETGDDYSTLIDLPFQLLKQ